MTTHHVCVNPWRWEEGHQTYSDGLKADGWSVYVRTEPDRAGMFDVLEDEDRPTYGAAMARARDLAKKYDNAEIREY